MFTMREMQIPRGFSSIASFKQVLLLKSQVRCYGLGVEHVGDLLPLEYIWHFSVFFFLFQFFWLVATHNTFHNQLFLA